MDPVPARWQNDRQNDEKTRQNKPILHHMCVLSQRYGLQRPLLGSMERFFSVLRGQKYEKNVQLSFRAQFFRLLMRYSHSKYEKTASDR